MWKRGGHGPVGVAGVLGEDGAVAVVEDVLQPGHHPVREPFVLAARGFRDPARRDRHRCEQIAAAQIDVQHLPVDLSAGRAPHAHPGRVACGVGQRLRRGRPGRAVRAGGEWDGLVGIRWRGRCLGRRRGRAHGHAGRSVSDRGFVAMAEPRQRGDDRHDGDQQARAEHHRRLLRAGVGVDRFFWTRGGDRWRWGVALG